MSRLDFIRNHDVFCSCCGTWAPLRNTNTIAAAVKAAQKVGFHIYEGRMHCATCIAEKQRVAKKGKEA